MSKILVITPFFSRPQVSGGSIRVKNIIRQISSHHKVECLYFRDQLDEKAKPAEFVDEKVKYYFWPNRVNIGKLSTSEKISSLMAGKSLKGPTQYPVAPVKSKLKNLIKEGAYDFILVEFTWLSEMVEFIKAEFPSQKLIVDSHNVESHYDLQEVQSLPVLSRPMARMFAKLLAKEEKRVIDLSDETFCVSQTDLDLYHELFGVEKDKMRVAPNGVDVASYEKIEGNPKIKDFDLVFVGWMRYPPNIRSAKFIVNEVLPLLPEKTTLAIVGGDPPPEIKDFSSEKIFVSGTVEDVKPYLKKAKVFVAPIFEGSGTRLKILEAFAAGKPVVCTPKAAEGIDYSDGKDIFIVKSAEQFSGKIKSLLESKDLYDKVAAAAKTLATQKYDWAVAVSPIIDYIESNWVERGVEAEKLIEKFAKKLSFQGKQTKTAPFSLVICTMDRCPHPPGENEGLNPPVACFRSIMDQKCLPDEVVFVDDSKMSAPHDYTSQMIEKFITELDRLGIKHAVSKRERNERSNAAIGRNRGLKLCSNNFVYFVDDDVVFPSHSSQAAIELMVSARERDKDLAMVNLPQNHRASLPYKIANKHYFENLDLATLNLNRNVASTAVREYLTDEPPMEDGYLKPLELKNFQGGNIIVCKDVLDKIGGFVDFGTEVSYGEETGLSFKLTSQGHKIYYYPYIDIAPCHLQQGNHSGKNKLFGPDFLAGEGRKITLAKLVEEADKPCAFQTGCRVSSTYYIYMKMRNNYLVFDILGKNYASDWEKLSYSEFVEQNDQTFIDNRKHKLDKESREELWKMAFEDAKKNHARTIVEIDKTFS